MELLTIILTFLRTNFLQHIFVEPTPKPLYVQIDKTGVYQIEDKETDPGVNFLLGTKMHVRTKLTFCL